MAVQKTTVLSFTVNYDGQYIENHAYKVRVCVCVVDFMQMFGRMLVLASGVL